jgi:hypothetical protein
VPMYFAALFGIKTVTITASATAASRGGAATPYNVAVVDRYDVVNARSRCQLRQYADRVRDERGPGSTQNLTRVRPAWLSAQSRMASPRAPSIGSPCSHFLMCQPLDAVQDTPAPLLFPRRRAEPLLEHGYQWWNDHQFCNADVPYRRHSGHALVLVAGAMAYSFPAPGALSYVPYAVGLCHLPHDPGNSDLSDYAVLQRLSHLQFGHRR